MRRIENGTKLRNSMIGLSATIEKTRESKTGTPLQRSSSSLSPHSPFSLSISSSVLTPNLSSTQASSLSIEIPVPKNSTQPLLQKEKEEIDRQVEINTAPGPSRSSSYFRRVTPVIRVPSPSILQVQHTVPVLNKLSSLSRSSPFPSGDISSSHFLPTTMMNASQSNSKVESTFVVPSSSSSTSEPRASLIPTLSHSNTISVEDLF